jgi:hypothetical protein|tara:strand:+ start:1241 stop:1678 length:438 start_codon:yes stop_codon:yes gene_type:complete
MARFAQGKYTVKNPSKYVGGRSPTYRSSWEFTFMKFCDEHQSIQQWASEAIKIPYRNPLSGKQTIYVPDFFIVYLDANGKQKVELIEVKPANQAMAEKVGRSRHNQLHFAINQAKWSAARAYCKQKGIFFRIITEGDMFHTGKRR